MTGSTTANHKKGDPLINYSPLTLTDLRFSSVKETPEMLIDTLISEFCVHQVKALILRYTYVLPEAVYCNTHRSWKSS